MRSEAREIMEKLYYDWDNGVDCKPAVDLALSELIKLIEGLRKEYKESRLHTHYWEDGYNAGIDSVLNLLRGE